MVTFDGNYFGSQIDVQKLRRVRSFGFDYCVSLVCYVLGIINTKTEAQNNSRDLTGLEPASVTMPVRQLF